MAFITGQRARFDAVRTLAFGAIGVGYTALGSPLGNAGRMMYILNTTNASLMFSADPAAAVDHFALPSQGYIVFDIATNATEQDGLYLTVGTQFWVKQISAPTSGDVYLTILYGRS